MIQKIKESAFSPKKRGKELLIAHSFETSHLCQHRYRAGPLKLTGHAN